MKKYKNWIERARTVMLPKHNAVYTVLKYWQQYEGLHFSDADIKFFSTRLTSPETILRDTRRYKIKNYEAHIREMQQEVQKWMEEDNDHTQAS